MLLLLIFSKVFELFCWRLTSWGYTNDYKLFYSVFLLCLDWHLYTSNWNLHTDSEDPSCYRDGLSLWHRLYVGLHFLIPKIICHLVNFKIILDLLFELFLPLSFVDQVTFLYPRNEWELVRRSRFDKFWYGMRRISRVHTSRIFQDVLGRRCCIVFSAAVLLRLYALENFIFFPSWFVLFRN